MGDKELSGATEEQAAFVSPANHPSRVEQVPDRYVLDSFLGLVPESSAFGSEKLPPRGQVFPVEGLPDH